MCAEKCPKLKTRLGIYNLDQPDCVLCILCIGEGLKVTPQGPKTLPRPRSGGCHLVLYVDLKGLLRGDVRSSDYHALHF